MIKDMIGTKVRGSTSIISFESDKGNYWEGWDRYIAIDGKKAYQIGNVCETCIFFFERLEGANRSVNPELVTEALNRGIEKLDKEFIRDLEKILPDGRYIVILSEVDLLLTSPGDSNDYFANEQIDLCGRQYLGGNPHSPKTEYYRLSTKNIDDYIGFYEFLIPTFPLSQLNDDQVEQYKVQLHNRQKPSMVTLSVLDIWTPEDPEDMVEKAKITEHWCLAHYLIDGHHKAYAAAMINKPLTMISFLAVRHGICGKKELKKAMSYLKA
jgi:hypothetical protein